MKYILIDEKDGDMFTAEFATKEEAIAAGNRDFARLTAIDKKHRTAFYVLESENPDEEAENHMDGTVVKEWI